MQIIKTQQDLVVLRHARALPSTLINQVEDYFNQLWVELEDGCKEPNFSPSLMIRFLVSS